MLSRSEIARSAAGKLVAAKPVSHTAVLGFDGFVDDIIDVVDKRQAFDSYERLLTIPQFAAKVSAAAGQSSNMELVIKQQKLGGNGPIMANALAAIGFATTYIGTTGYPSTHPVFAELARQATLLPLAEPAHTSALEFSDGKIMLGNLAPLAEVTWDRLVSRVGEERLRGLFDAADVVGTVNWTMLPHLTAIWQHLLSDILPRLSKKPRLIFVDLADPEKRMRADLRAALEVLAEINLQAPVTLGLNLSEAMQVAEACGCSCEGDATLADLAAVAGRVREALHLGTVVIHPRSGAAAATAEESAHFEGPFVESPKISTGAGDHFNAGFAAARLLGLTLGESLAMATATSGYYVRTAVTPRQGALAEFLANLPGAQNAGRAG
ncbi:MAG TPA: PfkB family carbohydrate kinase [Phycisphaerae bacterium]|nr:PfkB family carbohydrate kinase [Phycisphaerae bacterium]